MTFHNIGLINYIQFFWVSTIFLIIWLAIRRIQPTHMTYQWQYSTNIAPIKPRGNVITLMKIYSRIIRSTPSEIATNIRDELSSNAATLYNKPNAFFVRYRSEDKVMRDYFHDEELRLFFKDPRFWARVNGGVRESFFGLIKDENSPSESFYRNLERILTKFEKEIAGGKRSISQ